MDHQIIINGIEEEGDGAFFSDWLVEVGEAVTEGEPIAEIMTDKVTLDILSPATGVLASADAEPEAQLKLGQVIGIVRSAD